MTLALDAQTIARAGVAAVLPGEVIRKSLVRKGRTLRILGQALRLDSRQRLGLLAFGKAAVGMAEAAETILGDLVAHGVVIYPQGNPPYHGTRLVAFKAGHPVPNHGSREGGRAALDLARTLGPRDPILVLISGGGSSLMECPVEGIGQEEIAVTYRQLVRSNLPIGGINAVRKHLSGVKGGRLATAWGVRPVTALALSDVVGNDPATIASGPTVADPTTYADAERALKRHGLWPTLPRSVREEVVQGRRGLRTETPKPGDPRLRGSRYTIIGDTRTALVAASREARRSGYKSAIVSSQITGETSRVARGHARLLRALLASSSPQRSGWCVLSGGETTVSGTPKGKGGRNQEFVLAAARPLKGLKGVLVLSMGTDGVDGPTDAAGGWVSGETVTEADRLGVDLHRALADHASYDALDRLGTLWKTGPTGTNVADIHVMLAEVQLARSTVPPGRPRGRQG